MRLMVLAPDFLPQVGGIATFMLELSRALTSLGVELVVWARPAGEEESDEMRGVDVRRYTAGFAKARAGFRAKRWPIRSIAFQNWLRSEVRRYKPDLILVGVARWEADSLASVVRETRIPYVMMAYGKEINRLLLPLPVAPRWRWKRRIRRSTFLRASRIVAISDYTRERVARLGVAPQRIALVYPGVRPYSASSPVRKRSRRQMLFLGRLVERKGADTAIRALAIVRSTLPDALLVVAGDGPARPALERLARNLDLEDAVLFRGGVTEDAKAQLLEESMLLVMPNRAVGGDVEGFGMVFLEASAHGLPVIGGRSGGSTEAIVDRETGILVDPGDIGGLASAMLSVLTEAHTAHNMGRRGLSWAGRFTWEASANSLLAVLNDAVGTK